MIIITAFFVFTHSKVFSENTQLWLPKFETRGKESDKVDDQNDHIPNNNEDTDVPLLVCMTFADKVLAEVMDEDGKYDKVTAKQEVEEHFQVGPFITVLPPDTTACSVTGYQRRTKSNWRSFITSCW